MKRTLGCMLSRPLGLAAHLLALALLALLIAGCGDVTPAPLIDKADPGRNDIGATDSGPSTLDNGKDAAEDPGGTDSTLSDPGAIDSGSEDAADAADANDPGTDACTPLTCAELNACGQVDDECGGMLSCTCTAPETCGGAGFQGQCGRTVDIRTEKVFSVTAPGPMLAMWSDGSILTTDGQGNAEIRSATGTGEAFPLSGSRPSILIASDASVEIVVHKSGPLFAHTKNKSQKWVNGAAGGGGQFPEGFSIDPDTKEMIFGQTELVNLEDGTVAKTGGSPVGKPYLLRTYFYQVGVGAVTRRERSDLSVTWTTPVGPTPPVQLTGGALLADDSIVVVSSKGNLIARVQSDGTKVFQNPVSLPTAPVVTEDNLVVVGAGGVGAAQVNFINGETGVIEFVVPVDAQVTDLLVGDDLLVYAAIRDGDRVVAIDPEVEQVRVLYRGVDAPQEMLLRHGVIYAWGRSRLTAFKVGARRYDPDAPWPVRFHDNQRTNSATSTLDF